MNKTNKSLKYIVKEREYHKKLKKLNKELQKSLNKIYETKREFRTIQNNFEQIIKRKMKHSQTNKKGGVRASLRSSLKLLKNG